MRANLFNDTGVYGGKAWESSRGSRHPSDCARLLQAARCLVRRKARGRGTRHLHRPQPAIRLHLVSFQGSCNDGRARPDTFPRVTNESKPNFETLPDIGPASFSSGRHVASRLQPLSLRRPRPHSRSPPAPGLRRAGDKEAAAPPRPPGPSPRGQLRAPPPAARLARCSRLASPRLTGATGTAVPRPPLAAAAG